jgi:ABC-type transport system involved in multi-copper enzyme maturation permease subunit
MILIYGFVLVILSVIFGTGVISQEVEQKTIPYLLTRPMPRWRIALAKLAAAVTTITVTVWLALVLLALVALGPAGLSPAHIGRDLWVLPIGAMAYGSLFLLVATLLNRPLLWGLGYTFGWEALVGNLPGDAQRFSIMTYLRVLSPHPLPEGETIDASRLLAAFFPQSISPTFSVRVLIATTLVALALALLCFSTREYVPREDTD